MNHFVATMLVEDKHEVRKHILKMEHKRQQYKHRRHDSTNTEQVCSYRYYGQDRHRYRWYMDCYHYTH